MDIFGTKHLTPKGFELGTTMSKANFSCFCYNYYYYFNQLTTGTKLTSSIPSLYQSRKKYINV